MGKPPKIVVTDIDEDPNIKRQAKIKEIKDWSALLVIVLLLWLMAATRMCFILGSVMASMTSIIATIQFVILIKSSYSRHIGNYKYKNGPQYQMPLNVHIRRCKEFLTCKHNKISNENKTTNRDGMNDGIPKMHSPL